MKVKGRQVRRSLETGERALAKRRLVGLQHRDLLCVDVGAGRPSLADRFLATATNQPASTRAQKTQIADCGAAFPARFAGEPVSRRCEASEEISGIR